MTTLRLILGDQLSPDISALNGCDLEKDLVLMCEVMDEATYVKHHKKKIAFLFSGMRHFADALREQGYKVQYVTLTDPTNSQSFQTEVARAIATHSITKVVATHPNEFRVLEDMQTWQDRFGIPVDIRPDTRFLCTPDEFGDWAKGRKQLRMEYFYRDMRRKYNILMDGDAPIGGQWNFDADNRKPPQNGLDIPAPFSQLPDDITSDVIDMVGYKFANHFGDLMPFHYAVTREGALKALDHFIIHRLANFGDYQDAMLTGEPWMYHSHISFYLNCGLLDPLECAQVAEQAYHHGVAPLNAVEGFIRQIIGWREYIRGIYWIKMPEYAHENYLNAQNKLPEFFWTGDTKMNCLRQCVLETKQNAYAHHIQRLMVLGNFALIAGIDPKYVNEWFLIVYADAYEWVELPNVSGMILFSDGGYLASKPYAASGAYINKMSDYCKNCSYNVSAKNGPTACPFNYFYWDFFIKNQNKLRGNPRLNHTYSTLSKMDDAKKAAITDDVHRFWKSVVIYE
jgi:deoxyribodipyrimidine photolyase-related protein